MTAKPQSPKPVANQITLILALLFLLGASVSCKLMPGWKQLSEAGDQRSEREAEEKIQKSESFRTLHDLCTKRIPIHESFVYVSKHASWKGSDYLTYFYRSDNASQSDWQKVKAFYRDFFLANGWQLVKEYDTNWGSSKAVYRNDRNVIRIYYKGLGDADFGFHCGNFPELDENGKPQRFD